MKTLIRRSFLNSVPRCFSQFEPVIQPGNEGFVHHMIIYTCFGEMDDSSHGKAWDCANRQMPEENQCLGATLVWAVGGTVREVRASKCFFVGWGWGLLPTCPNCHIRFFY